MRSLLAYLRALWAELTGATQDGERVHGWLAIQDLSDPGTAHVMPMCEYRQHEDDGDDCTCGPSTQVVPRDDGSMGWVITHRPWSD